MHELALMEDLVTTVSDAVGDATVLAVRLEVGLLSGVVADSLRFCFDVCTQGTRLERAALDIIDVPGLARCNQCEQPIELGASWRACPCGSWDLALVRGEELRLLQVEVC